MRSLILALLPLALATAVPSSKKVDYNGFKSLRITLPKGAEDAVGDINKLAATILNPGATEEIDIVVSPENLSKVKKLASDTTVLVEDVGAALAEEETSKVYAVPSDSWFTAYHSYADHLQFLTDLQTSYPTKSEIFTLGNSFQGRPLTGIHIWGSGGKGSKPAIVFHGTVHAREWIATMTAEYMAYQLLTKYSTDSAVKAIVDKFDFYITPVVNPDGFVYTQTTNRLWRKNRQTVSGNSCVGRDINRNWPYKWELTGGASTDPCDETFKGRAAGDSPENKAIKGQIDTLAAGKGITFYVDFHSYGQYILWPYGYDCSVVSPEEAALSALATRLNNGIKANSGNSYTTGNSCRALYATTGDSLDYIQGVAKAKYSYTIELRDKGTYGFSLPANQIQPTVRETWAGVVAALGSI
ncbi:related to carboxypeptidase A [Fusarium torulosum]|uniref:Related to carboxypeptidase A n=1 Tax=Fusarium torulosum TaxID=33205 RepID=A0AAE8M354_9HYPO|nr:related to carboxypeptidase A [Fusarium torulosum]